MFYRQSSTGTSSDASLAMGFENTGGSIELKDVVIQNIQIVTTLFQTTAGGTTTISSSSISNSVLPVRADNAGDYIIWAVVVLVYHGLAHS